MTEREEATVSRPVELASEFPRRPLAELLASLPDGQAPGFLAAVHVCAADQPLIAQFDRLSNANLALRGATIDLLVDQASGRQDDDIQQFIEFCAQAVWARLSDEARDDFMVSAAATLAREAHAGQLDKANRPYIEHVERVAARVAAEGGEASAQASAWLHDVVEDCPAYAAQVSRFPGAVREVVRLLTRTPAVSQEDYYAAIRGNAQARRVKVADLMDNSDPVRLAKLPADTAAKLTAKYAKAFAALGVEPQPA